MWRILSDFASALAGLTANRLIKTDGSKQLETPAALTSDQSLSLTNASGIQTQTAATQDAIRIAGRAGGSSSYIATLTVPTLAASVTHTLPAITTTLGGLAVVQSWTAINTFANTTDASSSTVGGTVVSGGLAVAKSLYVGTYLNVLGDGYVGSNAGVQSFLFLNAAVGTTRTTVVRSAGSNRWQFGGDASAESGSDAGTAFVIIAANDAGSSIDTPLTILRAGGGLMTLSRPASFTSTTDATSSTAASVTLAGGLAVVKNIVAKQGRGTGVTSTATAAGTTTLTSASTEIQKFTGTNTQTIQFPAANLFGAGVAVLFTINNQSTMTVTPTRAGADTFVGGGTTDPVLTLASTSYASDGVSLWMKI